MADKIHFDLVSPEQMLLSEDVTMVTLPGTEGYFGVLAHHAAMVTALAKGTLTVRSAGAAEERWEVAGGFFEVSNNAATVLADAAGPAKG